MYEKYFSTEHRMATCPLIEEGAVHKVALVQRT